MTGAVSALSWWQPILTVQLSQPVSSCAQVCWRLFPELTARRLLKWQTHEARDMKKCEVVCSMWSSGRHVEVGTRWSRIWRKEKSRGKCCEINLFLRRWKIICLCVCVCVCVLWHTYAHYSNAVRAGTNSHTCVCVWYSNKCSNEMGWTCEWMDCFVILTSAMFHWLFVTAGGIKKSNIKLRRE